jgi:pimeloyl-ACP methyl ester carboxylesterase
MNKILFVLIGLLFTSQSFALREGLFEVSENHHVYYRYQKAESGKPTVVLLNGLIYAIENWDEYFDELSKSGVGVLQMAYSTQPESLVDSQETPFYAVPELTAFGWVPKGIETQTLVDESMTVIDALEIERFSLASLSYGSIVAAEMAVQEKKRIDQLILMAPAVMSSGRYNPYGQSRHNYYTVLKAAGNPAADISYDTELFATLSAIITPLKYNFEDVSFTYFFAGVYQMVRSSKWFDLKDYADADLPPTYMFLASLEDRPLYKDQLLFWEMMDENNAKKGLVTFEGSFHAIPGVAPEKCAEQTLLILEDKLKASESKVKVGTGNPPGTMKDSLVDFFSNS